MFDLYCLHKQIGVNMKSKVVVAEIAAVLVAVILGGWGAATFNNYRTNATEQAVLSARDILEREVIPAEDLTGEVYVNEFYPNTEIALISGWDISTTALVNEFDDSLVDRQVALRKGDTNLTFYFEPTLDGNCGSRNRLQQQTNNTSANTLQYDPEETDLYGSGLNRFNVGVYGYHYSQLEKSSANTCHNILIEGTNGVQINDAWVFITVNRGDFLDEADQIVANSLLR